MDCRHMGQPWRDDGVSVSMLDPYKVKARKWSFSITPLVSGCVGQHARQSHGIGMALEVCTVWFDCLLARYWPQGHKID